MIALASLGLGTAATTFAQQEATAPAGAGSSASSSATAGHEHEHGHGKHHHGTHKGMMGPGPGPGGPIVGTTLRATQKLNLTAAQKSQIKTIMQNAHEQQRSQMQSGAMDPTVLGDPSNPGYSAALQNMKSHASDRIQQESEIQSQIYGVLTPDQKAKLPSVLASIKEKHEAHREAAAERSATPR